MSDSKVTVEQRGLNAWLVTVERGNAASVQILMLTDEECQQLAAQLKVIP